MQYRQMYHSAIGKQGRLDQSLGVGGEPSGGTDHYNVSQMIRWPPRDFGGNCKVSFRPSIFFSIKRSVFCHWQTAFQGNYQPQWSRCNEITSCCKCRHTCVCISKNEGHVQSNMSSERPLSKKKTSCGQTRGGLQKSCRSYKNDEMEVTIIFLLWGFRIFGQYNWIVYRW